MAIVPNVPGLQVEIVVNGAPLHEHVDPDDEESDRTVTRYVEAISGAEFALRYRFDPVFEATHAAMISICVDGKVLREKIHKKTEYSFNGVFTITGQRSKEGDRFYLSKFCFAELNIVDEISTSVNQVLTDTLKNMGTISVEFHWIEITSPEREPTDNLPIPLDTREVPEKALKGRAISHSASLKDRQSANSYVTCHTVKIGNGLPFATFNFKYRSKDALKSLHIIPRSPSPVPLEDRDVNSLSLEEMRELVKRQREREKTEPKVKQAGSTAVKRERTGDDEGADRGDDNLTVVSVKRRRAGPTCSQAVIDLT